MAKLTIYLKGKNDLATPEIIEISPEKIIATRDNETISEVFGDSPPMQNSIYLLIAVDSKQDILSNKYDYYLKGFNEVESVNIFSGSESDGYLKITNMITFVNEVGGGDAGVFKFKTEKGVHFQTPKYLNESIFSVHIWLKKTLKNRPLRCKGESNTARNFVISENIPK
jgi:hypothetical protein